VKCPSAGVHNIKSHDDVIEYLGIEENTHCVTSISAAAKPGIGSAAALEDSDFGERGTQQN